MENHLRLTTDSTADHSTQAKRAAPFQELIHKIEARLDIETALADYCIGIDDRDPDRWVSAFHHDAVFDVDYPAQICRGHAAIIAWVQGPWGFDAISHLSGNSRIQFIDETHAEGIAHATAMFRLKDGSSLLGTARYSDKYSAIDGIWRIAYRKVHVVQMGAYTSVTYIILNGKAL